MQKTNEYHIYSNIVKKTGNFLKHALGRLE